MNQNSLKTALNQSSYRTRYLQLSQDSKSFQPGNSSRKAFPIRMDCSHPSRIRFLLVVGISPIRVRLLSPFRETSLRMVGYCSGRYGCPSLPDPASYHMARRLSHPGSIALTLQGSVLVIEFGRRPAKFGFPPLRRWLPHPVFLRPRSRTSCHFRKRVRLNPSIAILALAVLCPEGQEEYSPRQ